MYQERNLKLVTIKDILKKYKISKGYYYGVLVSLDGFPDPVNLRGLIRFDESKMDAWILNLPGSEEMKNA
jgi:predicted DNA-binding transcriptional regulator AlpA